MPRCAQIKDDVLRGLNNRLLCDVEAMEADPVGYIASVFGAGQHFQQGSGTVVDTLVLPAGQTIDIGADIIVLPEGKAIITEGTPCTLMGTNNSRIQIEGSVKGNVRDLLADSLIGSTTVEVILNSKIDAGDWCIIKASTQGPLHAQAAITSASSDTVFAGGPNLSNSNDTYNTFALTFTSGANVGETQTVSDYVGSTKTFTMAASFTATPSVSDTFNVWAADYTTKIQPQQLALVTSVAAGGGGEILTLDRVIAHDFYALNIGIAATVQRVEPVSNCTLHNVNLDGVRINMKLAREVDLYAPSVKSTAFISMDASASVACDSVRVCCTGNYDTGGGPDHLVFLIGCSNLNTDLNVTGGAEDGIRIWGCSDIVSRSVTDLIDKRSVWHFACNHGTVSASCTNCVEGGTGTPESILFDYCTDMTIGPLLATGMGLGDAIEFRGTCKDLTVTDVTVTTDVVSDSTATCMNIHGNFLDNLTIDNFTLTGSLHAIDVRDGATNVTIKNGTIIKRGGEGGNCIRVGRAMVSPITNLDIDTNTLTTDGTNTAIHIGDADGTGHIMDVIDVTDNTVVAATGVIDDYIFINPAHTSNVTNTGNVLVAP